MGSKRSKIIFGVAAARSGVGLYRAWHGFAVEDEIHGTFFPVVRALADYEYDHGSPASALAKVVPDYIAQLPSSRLADSVEYSVIGGGKAWQLSIHSHALHEPRVYCCRSTHRFTADEEQRVVLRYHGC